MPQIKLGGFNPDGRVALVDGVDARRVRRHRWTLTEQPRGYPCAVSTILGRLVTMHRFILGFPEGDTDHINGDRLDNRRSNLRTVSHAANLWNSIMPLGASGLRGVCRTRTGRWRAQISRAGRVRHLGTFDTPEDAASAYDAAVDRLRDRYATKSDGKRRAKIYAALDSKFPL